MPVGVSIVPDGRRLQPAPATRARTWRFVAFRRRSDADLMGASVLWELARLRRYMGGAVGVAFYVLGVTLLGIVAPWYLGFAFLELPALLIYACLPCLFVPPVLAESVAGASERELRPSERAQRRDWLYGKIGAAAVYGWLSVVFILV